MAIARNIDFIVATGGHTRDQFDESTRILRLNCADTYEGLPEKVRHLFSFMSDHDTLGKYQYYCKLDSDMIVRRKFWKRELSGIDYGGYVKTNEGNRNWHIGKCSPGSEFNNKPYEGEYIPWCLGGKGYVLSKKAVEAIASDRGTYHGEIYEDLAIAKILARSGIAPSHIHNLSRIVASPEHSFG